MLWGDSRVDDLNYRTFASFIEASHFILLRHKLK
jgi:hypothetical protein